MQLLLFIVAIVCISIVNAAYNITNAEDSMEGVKGLEAGFELEATATGGYNGFDISQVLTSSVASCLASNGYSFGVVRGYRSSGSVDPNVCSSLKQMGAFKGKDVYLFPDPTSSKSASTQMGELVSYLNSNCKSSWSGRVWLDVEGSQYWLGSNLFFLSYLIFLLLFLSYL